MERVRERELESEINKRSIWSCVLDESNCSYFYFFAKKTTASLASSLVLRHAVRLSPSTHTQNPSQKVVAHTKKKGPGTLPARRDATRERESGGRGVMIHFALLFSKQGKIRLSKYYEPYSQASRLKLQRDVMNLVIPRPSRLCNVVDYKTYKLVYKRYASLYFVFAVDADDNVLLALEKIQRFVEILDGYFGNVCELDLIYQFTKAYYVLDEVFVAGEMQESSKRLVARLVNEQDALVEQMKVQDE